MFESTLDVLVLAAVLTLLVDAAHYARKLAGVLARVPRRRRRQLAAIDWTSDARVPSHTPTAAEPTSLNTEPDHAGAGFPALRKLKDVCANVEGAAQSSSRHSAALRSP
jgi:hypothetical protein